jgi:hypothetical protein
MDIQKSRSLAFIPSHSNSLELVTLNFKSTVFLHQHLRIDFENASFPSIIYD